MATAIASVLVAVLISLVGYAFVEGKTGGEMTTNIQHLVDENIKTGVNLDKLATVVGAQGNQLAALAAQVDVLKQALDLEHKERVEFENRAMIRR